MRERIKFAALLLIVGLVSGLVFALLGSGDVEGVVAAFGWACALTCFVYLVNVKSTIDAVGSRIGLDLGSAGLRRAVVRLLDEVDRKNSALSTNTIERGIRSQEDLSQAHERIVVLAFRLLNAESAELALYDQESGLYHSSFVLGKPFQVSAQAMLSGAAEGGIVKTDPNVLVQPIAFAGSVLGTLRVGVRRGTTPSESDREIMRLLALQTGIAIINSQYTTELVRFRAVSEESVKAKTGFLANLSHEIRGPLGIMLNAVELVLDGLCGPVNEDQLETLAMVKQNGSHLLELMNDVLDYAKVESGKLAVERVEVSVHDLLEDIVKVMRAPADAKKHKLLFTPPPESLMILVDRRHARQMMINLLTNAIKYTPDGGTIEVWADRHPAGKIRISVRDSGVGIAQADRGKIFAAFERVDHAYSRVQSGTGLGMPLTKRLAEANCGSIDFESVPAKGSHFWLLFEGIDAREVQRAEEKEAPVAEGKGRSLLVLGDDDPERQMMVRYLEHIGFRVSVSTARADLGPVFSASHAKLAIIHNPPTDITIEALVRAVREAEKQRNVPLLLVSGHGFVYDIERFLKAGIDRCLMKPVHFGDLGRVCVELVESATPSEPSPRHSVAIPTRLRPDDIVH